MNTGKVGGSGLSRRLSRTGWKGKHISAAQEGEEEEEEEQEGGGRRGEGAGVSPKCLKFEGMLRAELKRKVLVCGSGGVCL